MRKKHLFFVHVIALLIAVVFFGCSGRRESAADVTTEVAKEESDDKPSPQDDINKQDENGWTALMYAVKDASSEDVTSLLEKGADILIVNHDNQSAYDLAVAAGHIQLEQQLLMVGETINRKYWVSGEDGLRLRDKPGLKSKTITVLSYRTEITVKKKSHISVSILGVEGHWCEVEYQGTQGWLFGAYIDDVSP